MWWLWKPTGFEVGIDRNVSCKLLRLAVWEHYGTFSVIKCIALQSNMKLKCMVSLMKFIVKLSQGISLFFLIEHAIVDSGNCDWHYNNTVEQTARHNQEFHRFKFWTLMYLKNTLIVCTLSKEQVASRILKNQQDSSTFEKRFQVLIDSPVTMLVSQKNSYPKFTSRWTSSVHVSHSGTSCTNFESRQVARLPASKGVSGWSK